MRASIIALLYLSVALFTASAAEPRKVKIPAGKTVNVATYVNMNGNLRILIRTRDGSNELRSVWWKRWRFGDESKHIRQKDSFETKIPVSWWKGVVMAKLKAKAVNSDTVLYIWEDAKIDKSFTFTW